MTFSPQDADAWYERNKHKLGVGDDLVIRTLANAGIKPHGRIFEYGCANGWRLMRFPPHCELWGSELSPKACRDADKKIKLNMEPAIASCDMVIFGFCLYLVPPQDLFKYVHHSDLILKDGGYLVIYDFWETISHSRVYKHNPALRSYKMDHRGLFLGHPAYKQIMTSFQEDHSRVTILKKDMAHAFPIKED